MRSIRHARDKGFTLVELLVVISIVALLISMLLPALSSAKAASYRAACASNMRQACIGFVTYMTDNNQWVPRFGNTAYHLVAPSHDVPNGIDDLTYVNTVTPDNIRHCPTYTFRDPYPPYVPGAPGGIGVDYQWSYSLPLLECEWAGGTGQRLYPYTGYMVNRVSTEGAYHPYVKLVPGTAVYASAVDGGWNITSYGSAPWDPLASFPLIADRHSYFYLGGFYSTVISHQANNARSFSAPGANMSVADQLIGGGNVGWLDGSVQWKPMNTGDIADLPTYRIGATPHPFNGIDGWTWASSPSAPSYNYCFWIKGTLR